MSEPETTPTPTISESAKTWAMLFITFVFIVLYVLTVVGVIKTDDAMQNLQPIVFVIIGYFFGRLPSARVESSLKEQVAVQSNAAAAARHSEKMASMEREMLEEKVKNARIALESGPHIEALERAGGENPAAAAIRILGS
jgi:hypothetical protein